MDDLDPSIAVRKVDVIVIGAGISGLTAAYHLLKKCPNLSIIVLEAKDRVGGRTLTTEMKTVDGTGEWDLGGQWVGTSQTYIMEMLDELGLATYPQDVSGRKYMQLGGTGISGYNSQIPSLPLFALLDINRFISKTEAMRKTIPMSDPYTCANAVKWDSMTLDSYMQQIIWTKAAKETLVATIRCMLGVESSQISLLYYLMYLQAGDGVMKLVDTTEDAAQGLKIKGGAQQISKMLTNIIKTKNVLTNHPVVCVNQGKDHVEVRCLRGEIFRCGRLVISTPPHQTASIMFHPSLPLDKRELFRRMPVSLLTKIIITYPEAFWRQRGDSGSFVTNGGPIRTEGCGIGPICITFDASSHDGKPALVVFLGGYPAIEWSQVKVSERQKGVLDSLHQIWGQVVYDYLDYLEKDWSDEPYNEGSPVNCVAPGGMKYFVTGLRHPFLRCHFAGTESASHYCGYMSGAVQSGIRAATEVLYNIRPDFVTEDELQGTFYKIDNLQTAISERKPSVIGRAIKWSIGLGVVASAVFIGQRLIRQF